MLYYFKGIKFRNIANFFLPNYTIAHNYTILAPYVLLLNKKDMLTIVPPMMIFWHVSNAPYTISDLKTNITRT